MIKKTSLVTILFFGGLLVPSLGTAHNYLQTTGYQDLINTANPLRGISFNDNRYVPYCNLYAQVSVKQASQRISQQCTDAISTPNQQLKERWSRDVWTHEDWCLSVSAHASKSESMKREAGLKACFDVHSHGPTKAQISKDCKANDNLHRKAANGDADYVLKCLNAGVSADLLEGNDWTPLHSASRNGRMNIAKLLLSRGASVNARDVTNRTPMDQAKIGKYPNLQDYLKSEGGVLSR